MQLPRLVLCILLLVVTGCQTTGGIERGRYFAIPAELARLRITDTEILSKIGAAQQRREALVAEGRAAAYYESYTLRGSSHRTHIVLSMLPHGWYWNVHSSEFGLEKELKKRFDNVLHHDIEIRGVSPVSSGHARSLYGYFRQAQRECVGFLLTSSASVLPNNYRNLVVGVTCAQPGQLITEPEVHRLLGTLTFDPPNYSGAGFSGEQADYIRKRTG